MAEGFEDLLRNNHDHRFRFSGRGKPGVARAGVAIVTCMDSRIDPLAMVGLKVGDAKVIRTPGGRLTPDALVGCILGAHLLQVTRILVVAHTRCAMASGEDADLVRRVREATGEDLSGMHLGASTDQQGRLAEDVQRLRSDPHLAGRVQVGGFLYDVDNGRLTQLL